MNHLLRIFFCYLFLFAIVLPSTGQSSTSLCITDGCPNSKIKQKIENNCDTLFQVIRNAADNYSKKLHFDKEVMTSEGAARINKMWQTSPMSCPPGIIRSRCLITSSGFQIRGIPVDILSADNDEARQELTVDFSPEGKITDVNIAIEMNRYEEIMAEQADELDYTRRQIIVNFVEDFRTAYNRKDIDLLESVFSDDALIITGRIIRRAVPPADSNIKFPKGSDVQYLKQTKSEYINRLRSVFKKNRFINVKFDEIEVVQHPKFDDIYGVTLKQFWKSDRYSDVGYLFLMIDFLDADTPLIHVRTWQPEKDPITHKIITPRESVFHLGDFPVTR